ncbi:MAG: DEAD/DEAH box helicase [Cytophagales bacterium]|nr:MAG: DEAD/DEAH box helicase [Cytophagales bacterium]TAF59901.1 MAG: DEAD/DEAH box helicase [Cytophagales bacterium]
MSALINPLQFISLFGGIQRSLEEDSLTSALGRIRPHVYSFINTLSEHKAHRLFASWHAKLHFIAQSYELNKKQIEQLDDLQRLIYFLRTGSNLEKLHLWLAVASFGQLVAHFSDTEPPAWFQEFLSKLPPEPLREILPPQQKHDVFFCTIRQNPKRLHDVNQAVTVLAVSHERYGNLELKIFNVKFYGQEKLLYEYPLADDALRLSNNMRLCFTNVEVQSSTQVFTTDDSVMVLLPDYTLDASAIASAYDSPLSFGAYLLKRLEFFDTNVSTLKGNLVNELFDRLIQNIDISYEDAKKDALSGKLLIDAAFFPKEQLQEVFTAVAQLFGQLRQTLQKLVEKEHLLTTEPTFLSHVYGIQGRLDLLIEHSTQPTRKDIIELKSGSFPDTQRNSLAWGGHLAQVACYNLLLNSAFEDRKGISAVLYAQDSKQPIRDCGSLQLEIRRAMRVRNQLVNMDWMLAEDPDRVLDVFFKKMSAVALPSFIAAPFAVLEAAWLKASAHSKAYVCQFLAFTMRELLCAKLGSVNATDYKGGQAALWGMSSDEKKTAFELLDQLQIVKVYAEEQILELSINQTDTLTSLRVGDIVWLYPQGQTNMGQLIKGSLLELAVNTVKVRYWHKHVSEGYFKKYTHWCIEPSFMEQTFNQSFASLGLFLKASQEHQDRFLGLREPQILPHFELDYTAKGINEQQNAVLKAALSAQDFYLVVGPPGTGKTSAMLKNMLHYLYHHTQENVVVLAFTNRATEEIADKAIQATEGDFVRLGTLESNHPHYIYTLQYEASLKTVKEKILKKRVFVGTVSGFFAYFKLFSIKKFDTLIVDEASQLLEPHLCGIIQYFKRFILIGDERQLPAVVTQPVLLAKTQDERLASCGIKNLTVSVFERLIKNAISNNWVQAFGMLQAQYRTHSRIADFYNQHFYGFLRAGSQWQHEPFEYFAANSSSWAESLLAKDRLLFIATPPEKHFKVSQEQARIAVSLAYFLKSYLADRKELNPHSIGIIAPFRAQIAEIYSLMDYETQLLITVDTVERFQGSERDFIIMTTVVSEEALLESIQSMDEQQLVDRKLNVALSRAKQQFVFLGVKEILEKSHYYRLLIESATKVNVSDVFENATILPKQ